jgi:sortase A
MKQRHGAYALELTAWLSGAILLGGYVLMRAWWAYASDADVAQFERARLEYASADAVSSRATTAQLPGLAVATPDTSTWSPKRISAYRDLLHSASAPQAVLRAPALRLSVPIYDGTSEESLDRGAGRIEGTAHIDDSQGNIGLAAHRDGFFRVLKDVKVGDTFYLDTLAATRVFRVKSTRVVNPSDVSVLHPGERPSLTLVTCYPFYFVGSAPQRFIVRAEEVSPQAF